MRNAGLVDSRQYIRKALHGIIFGESLSKVLSRAEYFKERAQLTRCLFETLVCSLVRLSVVLTSVVAALTVVFSAMLNVAVLDIESWKSCGFSEEWQPSVLLSANDPISHYVFSFYRLAYCGVACLIVLLQRKNEQDSLWPGQGQ